MRRVSIRRGMVAAALLALVAVGVSGCSDDPSFDAGRIEAYLHRTPPDPLTGLKVGRVSCPKGLHLEEGMTFTCTMSVAGRPVPVKVRLTHVESDRVTVTATPTVAAIDPRAAAAYVSAGLPALAVKIGTTDVQCAGGKPIPAIAGSTFECTMTNGPSRDVLHLKVTDDKGTVAIIS